MDSNLPKNVYSHQGEDPPPIKPPPRPQVPPPRQALSSRYSSSQDGSTMSTNPPPAPTLPHLTSQLPIPHPSTTHSRSGSSLHIYYPQGPDLAPFYPFDHHASPQSFSGYSATFDTSPQSATTLLPAAVPNTSQNQNYNPPPSRNYPKSHNRNLLNSLHSHNTSPAQGGSGPSNRKLDDLESPRKRIRRLSQDQDLELKRLAFEAAARPLSELAQSIISLENEEEKMFLSVGGTTGSSGSGSSAASGASGVTGTSGSNRSLALSAPISYSRDRQKQIFGMVWLLGACEALPTAVVPRNRIYARYVQICADNALKPLTPASFGKLIRILFPILTTRRLGVRGQSKYHYCGIKLVDEAVGSSPPSSQGTPASPTSLVASGKEVEGDDEAEPVDLESRKGKISELTLLQGLDTASTPLVYIPNILGRVEALLTSNLRLPLIYPFLPTGSDHDIADTLHSLYRVHCNLLFSALRYMQTKNLISAFSRFIGIVTIPVLKLWIHPGLEEWTTLCDMATYRAMTKMLTKLHSQIVPVEVRMTLREISVKFVPLIIQQLEGKVPQKFLACRVQCALKFVQILRRLLNVIETGQYAAKILLSSSERAQMYDDWKSVDIVRICKFELTCSAGDVETAYNILQTEVPILFQQPDHIDHSLGQLGDIQSNAADSLEKFLQFLAQIPSKFKISLRLYLLQATNLLSSCLREMSLAGGQGFGSWWVVRCWVDEFNQWLFELGGMLKEELKGEEPIEESQEPKESPDNDLVDLLGGAFDKDAIENIDDTSFTIENFLGRSDDLIQSYHST